MAKHAEFLKNVSPMIISQAMESIGGNSVRSADLVDPILESVGHTDPTGEDKAKLRTKIVRMLQTMAGVVVSGSKRGSRYSLVSDKEYQNWVKAQEAAQKNAELAEGFAKSFRLRSAAVTPETVSLTTAEFLRLCGKADGNGKPTRKAKSKAKSKAKRKAKKNQEYSRFHPTNGKC